MRTRVRLGLSLLVAAVSLGLLFHFVPIQRIAVILAQASGLVFAAGIALQFLNRGLTTVPLSVITASQGIEFSRGTLFRILLAVQFHALYLPGALAGGGAAWLKYLQHGAGKGAAAASIVINRGVALLVLVPIGSVALILDPHFHGRLPPLALLALMIASVLALLLFWKRVPHGHAPRGLNGGFRSRLMSAAAARLADFQRMPARDRTRVFIGAMAAEIGQAAAMWTFAQAVHAQVDFVSILWMRGALQLGLLFPFSIGGLGVRELGLVALGALVGVPAPDAIAWSFTILAGTVGIALAGGILEFAGIAWTAKSAY